ncbi:MAG: Nif3-like dinuclear metal center hexameric protein [Clostridia bacterium]
MKTKNILSFLEQFAPYELAESWDNCGLLVGDKEQEVKKVICALDVTQNVINEAINTDCNLIVAHHPLIFTSIQAITSSDPVGKMIMTAVKNDISIICMHTNLDSTQGGVNDALANKLGLQNIYSDEKMTLGRIGNLVEAMQFDDFLFHVKTSLNANGLKFVGSKACKKIAVLGGSGGKLMDFALRNDCDTYVTSDCSYDIFQKADNLGINLIDAGHFATENVIIDVLVSKINETFGQIACKSQIHEDIINFR